MTEQTAHDEGAASAALLSLYPFAEEQLKSYVDILASRGLAWGLLGPREGDKLWARHVANSTALVDVVPEGVHVADVGSGAGLPGLPLAIVRPDLRIALLEPLERRVEFLEQAVNELGLADRVRVVRARAEDYELGIDRPATFDVVTCRAVAPLRRLLQWTTRLFLPDGALIALKGRSAEDEVRKAASLLSKLRLDAQVLELSLGAGLEGTRAIRVCRA